MQKTSFLSPISSPLGDIYLAATDLGLSGLWFIEGQKYLPDFDDSSRFKKASHPLHKSAAEQIRAYFAGELRETKKDFNYNTLPFDLSQGTAFQQSVWQALLKIPIGAQSSYGSIAKQIGKPKANRAVGAAVGHNPVSILIPCHRVLGQNGSLTGYAGGLERKLHLLKLEGILL